MSSKQQKALFGNTARPIAEASKEVKIRHIANCLKADPAYGKVVAEVMSIPVNEVSKKA